MPLTGFWSNGICAASLADAVAALNSKFPAIEANYLTIGHAVASGSNGATLTTYSIVLTTKPDTWVDHVLAVTFSACDPALDPNQFIPPTPANILYVFSWGFGAVVFFFFLGFVIGTVAKAIKEG